MVDITTRTDPSCGIFFGTLRIVSGAAFPVQNRFNGAPAMIHFATVLQRVEHWIDGSQLIAASVNHRPCVCWLQNSLSLASVHQWQLQCLDAMLAKEQVSICRIKWYQPFYLPALPVFSGFTSTCDILRKPAPSPYQQSSDIGFHETEASRLVSSASAPPSGNYLEVCVIAIAASL